MLKKIFIVGNWKMNPATLSEAKKLFSLIGKGIKKKKNVEAVICPPFIYIPYFKKNNSDLIKLGAENCYFEQIGAFTGEISPAMLKSLGCEYVIVGHSERRKYFSETDETVNKKLKLALKLGLKPILCIDKIPQIKNGMEGILGKDIKKIMVAYEPIWAIGTGKACDYQEAKKFNILMKKILGDKHPTLYGGSVNADNALGYIAESGFCGLLIGGVSLKPKEFNKIIKIAGKG
jgi:triosephosphate isomerase